VKPARRPGTYILWLPCESGDEIRIGRLGRLALKPGYYAYVGSAFGPGGLAARLAHHLRPASRPHWHIDHLRQHLTIAAIGYAYDRREREHEWAAALRALPGAEIPLTGFGSSDCTCRAHLVWLPEKPPRLEGERRWRVNGQAACTGMA